MKNYELLATGIRLLGLYTIILGVQTAAYQYQASVRVFLSPDAGLNSYAFFGIIEVIMIFVGASVMIKFPVSISKQLVPKVKGDPEILSSTAKELQVSLTCILGVYILSWAIPDFIDNAIWILYSMDTNSFAAQTKAEYMINEVVTIVEIAIGLYLCLNSFGINRLIWRLRGAGIENFEQVEEMHPPTSNALD